MKTLVVEQFACNGAHSHYSLINWKTGETIVEELNLEKIQVDRWKYTCESCGDEVTSRTDQIPKKCPRCGSPYFLIPVEQRSKAGRPRKKKEA